MTDEVRPSPTPLQNPVWAHTQIRPSCKWQNSQTSPSAMTWVSAALLPITVLNFSCLPFLWGRLIEVQNHSSPLFPNRTQSRINPHFLAHSPISPEMLPFRTCHCRVSGLLCVKVETAFLVLNMHAHTPLSSPPLPVYLKLRVLWAWSRFDPLIWIRLISKAIYGQNFELL